MKCTWVVLLSLVLLGGCARPGSDLPPIGEAADGGYRLGPGDRVSINFVTLEILEDEYVISDVGTISVPLLGQVRTQGLTAEELEARLRQRIQAAQLENDPSVSVQVEQYRPFFILGEVQRPGLYPYIPQMTLQTAVAVSGGYTFRAEKDYAVVTRMVDDRVIEGTAGPSTKIMPGDAIQIHESWF